MTYGDVSKLMEEYAQELGYKTERTLPHEFSAGGITFRRTNIKDLRMIKLCREKQLTKRLVAKKGLKVPKTYRLNNVEFPAVIKPKGGTGGSGIKIVRNMKELLLNYKEGFFIEEFIEGTLYRVSVADRKVISILRQIPPNVTGDGTSSIKNLIYKKNIGRGDTPADAPLKVGYKIDLTRIPAKGEVVYLHPLATRALGGDISEMVDVMDEEFKKFAVDCVSSIPGCNFAGIDVIYDGKETTLLEINSQPHITAHYYPQGNTKPVLVHEFIVRAYLQPTHRPEL